MQSLLLFTTCSIYSTSLVIQWLVLCSRTPYSHVPKIGGKEVDLFLLFKKVQELGGFTKVCTCVPDFEFTTIRIIDTVTVGTSSIIVLLQIEDRCGLGECCKWRHSRPPLSIFLKLEIELGTFSTFVPVAIKQLGFSCMHVGRGS